MAVSLNVVKSLDNNRVLIQENKKKQQPRLFVVSQENTDKFIAQRKSINANNSFQKFGTYLLAPAVGGLVAAVVKLGTVGKIVAGLATGAVTFIGARNVDKKMTENLEKITMKNCDVQEVTGQSIEEIK